MLRVNMASRRTCLASQTFKSSLKRSAGIRVNQFSFSQSMCRNSLVGYELMQGRLQDRPSHPKGCIGPQGFFWVVLMPATHSAGFCGPSEWLAEASKSPVIRDNFQEWLWRLLGAILRPKEARREGPQPCTTQERPPQGHQEHHNPPWRTR